MSDLESRLENWGSWSRRQSLIYEQCASLEGNYRSKQPWDAVPINPPRTPEERDAYEISLAAATLRLRDHLSLKLGYVVRMEDHQAAKILTRELRERVKTIDMLAIYATAKTHLLDALRMGIVVRRTRTVDRVRQILPRTVDSMVD